MEAELQREAEFKKALRLLEQKHDAKREHLWRMPFLFHGCVGSDGRKFDWRFMDMMELYRRQAAERDALLHRFGKTEVVDMQWRPA